MTIHMTCNMFIHMKVKLYLQYVHQHESQIVVFIMYKLEKYYEVKIFNVVDIILQHAFELNPSISKLE